MKSVNKEIESRLRSITTVNGHPFSVSDVVEGESSKNLSVGYTVTETATGCTIDANAVVIGDAPEVARQMLTSAIAKAFLGVGKDEPKVDPATGSVTISIDYKQKD